MGHKNVLQMKGLAFKSLTYDLSCKLHTLGY